MNPFRWEQLALQHDLPGNIYIPCNLKVLSNANFGFSKTRIERKLEMVFLINMVLE